jgi:hypothetical protein
VTDADAATCYGDGNARPDDIHLLAEVVAIDGEIIEVIAERERLRKKRQERSRCHSP